MIKLQKLLDGGYEFFTGVPDSGLKPFIDEIIESDVQHITASGVVSASSIDVSGNIETDGKLIFNGFEAFDATGGGNTTLALGSATAWGTIKIGNASDTTLKVDITGDITASGDISGSSTSKLFMGGQATLGGINSTSHITSSGNISASGDLFLHGGDIDLKNAGAQSNIKFYCETNNQHYTKLQAAAHADYSGNVTTTLPTYDFTFKEPFFNANVTASGDISSSGNIILGNSK